jgi:hypothetical protein
VTVDYIDILKRAWAVTWRYRILWLFGIFVGGSSSYSGGGGKLLVWRRRFRAGPVQGVRPHGVLVAGQHRAAHSDRRVLPRDRARDVRPVHRGQGRADPPGQRGRGRPPRSRIRRVGRRLPLLVQDIRHRVRAVRAIPPHGRYRACDRARSAHRGADDQHGPRPLGHHHALWRASGRRLPARARGHRRRIARNARHAPCGASRQRGVPRRLARRGRTCVRASKM